MSPRVGENSDALCALEPLREGFGSVEALAPLPAGALVFFCFGFSFFAIALLKSALLNAGSADALVRTARKARSLCRPLKRAGKTNRP